MVTLSSIIENLRNERRMSKGELASKSGLTESYISQLTLGRRVKPKKEAVTKLANAFLLDGKERLSFFEAAGYSAETFQSVRSDGLGEAPTAQEIYGREKELSELTRWIITDRCRIVLIQGIGGIGKTTLSLKIIDEIKDQFEFVIWRSLQDETRLQDLLKDCIEIISRQAKTEFRGNINQQLATLIGYLRSHRCLIILDNMETLLQPGENAGQFSGESKAYNAFLKQLGMLEHNSCLLLTSREKPRDIAVMESKASLVRTLNLSGIGEMETKKILEGKNIVTHSLESCQKLVFLYSGNPLAIKLVSQYIIEVSNSDLDIFLDSVGTRGEDVTVVNDIEDLIQSQYNRLQELEKSILCWLAIEREPISLETIIHDLEINADSFIPNALKSSILDAVGSLRRRSMIETNKSTEINKSALFMLQPVIMQFLTTMIINQACEEFETGVGENIYSSIWIKFAFVKALSTDYIRVIQQRLILDPLSKTLLFKFKKEIIKEKLELVLANLREKPISTHGYLPGNILNLLLYLQCDVRYINFSNLLIKQAYLQNVSLPDVNFTNAYFSGSVFTNTFGNVLAIAFSPTANLIAAGTATGDIWVYDLLNSRVIAQWQAHVDSVWSILYGPDGKTIMSGSDDKTVCIWDTSGKLLRTLGEHDNRVKSIALNPNASILASGSEDRTIRLWNVTTGECIKVLTGHTDRVWSVAFNHDGSLLASGSTDQTIRIWDVATGEECYKKIPKQEGWVLSIAFHPKDNKLLASGGDDQRVHLWDITTGEEKAFPVEHTKRVRAVSFDPKGHRLASASEDQTIRIWDVEKASCLSILDGGHSQGVRCIAYDQNGTNLVSGGDDQRICLWSVRKNSLLKTIHGYTSRIWSIVSARDSSRFASCSEDQTILVWNNPTDKHSSALQDRAHGVRAIAINSTGDFLISGGEDTTVRKWDINTRRSSRPLRGHMGWIRCVALSPDGQIAASGGEDAKIFLWDVNREKCLKSLDGHKSWIRSLAFSPDGKLLASGGDDQLIYLWKLDTQNDPVKLGDHHGHVRSVAFSPDGNIIAGGSEDKKVYLWEVSTGRFLKSLEGHTDRVLSVTFCSENLLASSSDDQTVILWDISNDKHKLLREHTDRVRSVAFNNDGLLLSCSDDGTINFWNIHDSKLENSISAQRPYEGMIIDSVKGLSEAQKDMLKTLGAIEKENPLEA